jgi:small conductance mechanosensitive channel
MSLSFVPIFAAANDAGTTNTVRVVQGTTARSLAQRFQEMTGMPAEVWLWIINIAGAVLLLVIGSIIAGIARNLVKKLFAKRAIDPTVGSFVSNLAHALIMTFVVISALDRFGVDTKSFAAIIAAAGLAIGLALQGGLSNFAAGFLIIVFRPFRAGDTINGAGIEGIVEEVQVFSTTLNTADNKRIIIPNSSLMNGTITNYTANPTRRVDVSISIGATQDLARAHQLMLALGASHPKALKTPPPATANAKLVDGGTQVDLRVWSKTGDYGDVLNDLLAQIPAALAQANIKGPDKTVYYVERKEVP